LPQSPILSVDDEGNTFELNDKKTSPQE
jgi:hypothetical protein